MTESIRWTPLLVEIASTGIRIEVPANRSILNMLLEHDYRIPYGCGLGVCGMCKTGIVDGKPEHWDDVLSAEERASGKVFTPCCSRAKSPLLVLDL